MPLQILIIGDQNRAEVRPLTEWMSDIFHSANVMHETDVPRAMQLLQQTGLIPDLIVVIESHPDEYSSSQTAPLTIHAPLARWVVCYGDWCESAGRTRDVWPLAVRVPLRSAPHRLQREWNLLNGNVVSPLPMSGSREEAFGADYQWKLGSVVPVSVLISSPDPEYRRYLSEFLAEYGHTVVGESDDSSPDVILYDLDPWGETRLQSMERLQSQHPGIPVIGLMSLPQSSILEGSEIDVLPKLGNQQSILEAIAQA